MFVCPFVLCCSGFKHCSVKKLVLYSVADISYLLGILSVRLLVGVLGLVLFVRVGAWLLVVLAA